MAARSGSLLLGFPRVFLKCRPRIHRPCQSIRCLSHSRSSRSLIQQNGLSLSSFRPFLSLSGCIDRPSRTGIFPRFFSSVIDIDDHEYTTIREEVKRFLVGSKAPDELTEKIEIELDKILKMHQCGALDGAQIDLSPEQLTFLASGIYQTKEKVPGAVFVSTPLFHSAAVGGNSPAKYTYAEMLRTGEGVAMDLKESIRLFTELAEKEDHPLAKFSVASFNYYGIGMKKNVPKALQLYQQCVESGIEAANTMIGHIYFQGEVIKQDLVKAVECYTKSANAGDPAALVALAHCHTHGKGGLDVNHEMAFKYYSQAAKQDHPVALYNVGVHHFTGQGGPQDFKKAAEFFKRAGDLGMPLAQVNLGNMYYNGFGVEQDWNKAKALYEAAAPYNQNAKLLLEELNQEIKKQR